MEEVPFWLHRTGTPRRTGEGAQRMAAPAQGGSEGSSVPRPNGSSRPTGRLPPHEPPCERRSGGLGSKSLRPVLLRRTSRRQGSHYYSLVPGEPRPAPAPGEAGEGARWRPQHSPPPPSRGERKTREGDRRLPLRDPNGTTQRVACLMPFHGRHLHSKSPTRSRSLPLQSAPPRRCW